MNVTGPQWWYVNIGSGNGLVPDTKPLPEPMLTQIYMLPYHDMVSLGPKELTRWNIGPWEGAALSMLT